MPDRLSRVWSKAADAIVVIAVAIGVLLGAYGVWAIHETHQIVVSHNTELSQTKAIAKELLVQSQRQTANHAATLNYLESVCASVPGCSATLQQLEAG